MKVKIITEEDIPKWELLSFEHDIYVKELVSDITEWYEGNENSPSYKVYMESKIRQKEAFMVIDIFGNCLGIIAFSKKSNRITFFGISKNGDIKIIGNLLLSHGIKLLDKKRKIGINLMCSKSDWINQYRELYIENGFVQTGDALENGVPVNVFEKFSEN